MKERRLTGHPAWLCRHANAHAIRQLLMSIASRTSWTSSMSRRSINGPADNAEVFPAQSQPPNDRVEQRRVWTFALEQSEVGMLQLDPKCAPL